MIFLHAKSYPQVADMTQKIILGVGQEAVLHSMDSPNLLISHYHFIQHIWSHHLCQQYQDKKKFLAKIVKRKMKAFFFNNEIQNFADR